MLDNLKELLAISQKEVMSDEQQLKLQQQLEEQLRKEEEEKARLEQREAYKESVFKKLETFLNDANQKDTLPDTTTEFVTLTHGSGYFFDNHGYKYTAIIVAQDFDTALLIDAQGITYKQTLYAGYNHVPLLNNSIIKTEASNVTTTLILVRTNVMPVW